MCLLTYATASVADNSTTLLNNTDEAAAKYFSPAPGNPYLPTDDLYRPYITFQLLSQLYNNHPTKDISLITQNNETGIVAIRNVDVTNHSGSYNGESGELYNYINMDLFNELNAVFMGTNVSDENIVTIKKRSYTISQDTFKKAKAYIVSTINRSRDANFWLSTISLADSLSSIASVIYGFVTDGSSNTKHSSMKPCDTIFRTVKVDGKLVRYAVYKYSKNGHGCNFAKGTDLEVVLIEALDTKFAEGTEGGCVTLYHDGSTVAYAKFFLNGSGIAYNDILCEAISGWGAPGSIAGTASP
ncbi:hypothetical protein KAFR_0F04445 [Kazachstania africana CBS 2517]|uniref:Uncharacterized protein n=1 Tax=Kazachstania africana (strain ATCC 22294 / BCRC 22015 / CBS 2517 / CECT 1963 / NBRC 1671 / NRRL Y-8276) TaxID=1071382 RepID=H2AXE0_KAZAF|nr:hypothetical protein KAFR_0F04445 [Kazachstania africana CBS 2517]CCF59040.1 hypothetical protein KAFR_0F04445 [Kazachstania africana CBS 2517]